MRISLRRILAAAVLSFVLLPAMLAMPAFADRYDCGQPMTDGDEPTTSDCLAILRAAVGQPIPSCSGIYFCVCDVNNNGSIVTTDALACLRGAVGQPVLFDCGENCPPTGGLACTSAEIFTRAGSDLDSGWTGIAHDSDIVVGASITVRVKRECSGNGAECEHDVDCTGNGTCEPTCNCNDDPTCEGTGPTHQRKCLNDLEDCSTNADCDPDIACVHIFGPPLPLSSGGTPVCVVSVFDGPITGTANSETGEGEIKSNLRSRVFLGIGGDRPCPSCGAPNQNPEVGDAFTCNGGPRNGQACTVEGVSAQFGGTSSDCPPSLDGAISGSGLAIRFSQVTTGTVSKTAQLPCKFFGFTGNPLVPGSNPKCLDRNGTGDPVCTSNADCKRCTEDVTIECTSNVDCGDNGACAEAPDQPISCGFWCNCGFCDANPSLPCFDTSDCANGQTCVMGTGGVNTAGMPQQRPNDCSNDGFVCGSGAGDERCATTLKSSCSEQPYRPCDDDVDCENFDAGFCNFEARPCFESRITRTGSPSPLGRYCAFESKTCDTNADCTQQGDFCAPDSSRAQAVALFCVPATINGAVNSAGGITGPGAVRLNGFMQVCRCGDSSEGCDEECDDGNTANGDGCDDLCQDE